MRAIQRLLIVEDEPSLAASVQATLADRAGEIRHVDTAATACALLAGFRPDLVILDVVLAAGTAFDVLAAAHAQTPTPIIVGVSGSAGPEDSFRLAQLGVRHFLAKPFTAATLRAAVDRAISTPPDLIPLLRSSVGNRAIRDVEDEVRRTMVEEALARTRGSRRGAAGLLAISRQLLQHILRDQG